MCDSEEKKGTAFEKKKHNRDARVHNVKLVLIFAILKKNEMKVCALP